MRLVDILPIKNWVELEKEIHKRSGFNASVFDDAGIRITKFQKWANKLCPVIKANEKGQSYICAVAHQNLAAQAMKKREPVVEECDAGLAKLVVPIFTDNVFLGVAGGCGLLLEGGMVDTFLINKITGIDIAEAERLSDNIKIITNNKIRSLTAYIKNEIDWITQDFENWHNDSKIKVTIRER